MIWRPIILEYFQNPLYLIGRAIIPLIMVGIAGIFGYAGLVLLAFLIFPVVAASAIHLVKLRMSGMLRRLIVCERSKVSLFFSYTVGFILLYNLLLFPSIIAGAWFEGISIIPYASLCIILGVICGTLVGVLSGSLGGVHLYAIIVTVPLVLLGIVRNPLGMLFPMAYVVQIFELSSLWSIPMMTVGISYSLLLIYVSRL